MPEISEDEEEEEFGEEEGEGQELGYGEEDDGLESGEMDLDDELVGDDDD